MQYKGLYLELLHRRINNLNPIYVFSILTLNKINVNVLHLLNKNKSATFQII